MQKHPLSHYIPQAFGRPLGLSAKIKDVIFKEVTIVMMYKTILPKFLNVFRANAQVNAQHKL